MIGIGGEMFLLVVDWELDDCVLGVEDVCWDVLVVWFLWFDLDFFDILLGRIVDVMWLWCVEELEVELVRMVVFGVILIGCGCFIKFFDWYGLFKISVLLFVLICVIDGWVFGVGVWLKFFVLVFFWGCELVLLLLFMCEVSIFVIFDCNIVYDVLWVVVFLILWVWRSKSWGEGGGSLREW